LAWLEFWHSCRVQSCRPEAWVKHSLRYGLPWCC
jgi:hypothetical protein